MTRYLLTILFSSVMGLMVPMATSAKTSIELHELDIQEVAITVTESSIRVTGGAGQMMHVYNLAGVCVASMRVDSSDKNFDLNLPKGCYIVKVGKVVRKVSVR
ncbi:MAG: DUF6383 domain-containing protein [Prevotellaceae bacterium]|nr:DUF6383 domain-containing protein [Prevotellaceae bacterium]MDY3364787.1 DUF6383 domain-containing protein [Prevotella sp.]